MKTISNKLRWIEHPENTCLVQLQVNQCGMWYTIEGTTTHTLNDVQKYATMQQYTRSLYGEEFTL